MCSSYEYLWEDGIAYKRPTKLSAPDYVDTLMNWVQARLDDEAVFPHKIGVSHSSCHLRVNLLLVSPLFVLAGVPFPRNFRDTVKTIIRRLFRVYAHIYSSHFEQICALGIEGVYARSILWCLVLPTNSLSQPISIQATGISSFSSMR